MCVQDIAISRRTRVVPRSYTDDTGTGIIVQANGNRIGLLMVNQPAQTPVKVQYPNGATPIDVIQGEAMWDNTDGLAVFNNNLNINYREHPGLIVGAFNIVGLGVGAFTWVELWVDADVNREADRAI